MTIQVYYVPFSLLLFFLLCFFFFDLVRLAADIFSAFRDADFRRRDSRPSVRCCCSFCTFYKSLYQERENCRTRRDEYDSWLNTKCNKQRNLGLVDKRGFSKKITTITTYERKTGKIFCILSRILDPSRFIRWVQ